MDQSVKELRDRYESISGEFVDSVHSMQGQSWRAICPVEGWPVGVTAHHVADWWPVIAGMVERMARGEPADAPAEEEVDKRNARHARDNSGCTLEETIELLGRNRERVLAVLGTLKGDDLERTAGMWGGQRSIRQLIEFNLIGHPQRHGPRMRDVAGVS